jgi:hypothetical protein
VGPRAAAGLALAAALLAVAPAAAAWKPGIRAAERYAAARSGDVAFVVRTPAHRWGLHGGRPFPSASVLKPMLMVAYLRQRSVRRRALHGSERALLGPMIRRSDNAAASSLVVQLGERRLRRLAVRAGMRSFEPVTHPWGHSRVTAVDQARFFLRIDGLIPRRHRGYAMRLLRRIVPSQRWGVGRVRPPGWRLHFKGGWGSGTGWVDHQVALLTRGQRRVSLAVFTYGNPSHAYGKATLRGVARRLLRGL